MKKIFILPIVFFINIALFSQSFIVLDAAKADVTNNSFAVSGEINTIIKAQMYIVNTTAAPLAYKVKKVETSVLPGTSNTFCFNDECYPPGVFESLGTITIQAGDTSASVDFYGEYSPGTVIGTSVIRYIITNAGDTSDYSYVDVSYSSTPTSVNEIDLLQVEFSNPYPNPAKSHTYFSYSFSFNFGSARIELRNIIGAVVKEERIADKQGKVRVEMHDLNEGVYFYSLVIDEKVILTRKLIKN